MVKAKLREFGILKATSSMVKKAKNRTKYDRRITKWNGSRYVDALEKEEYYYYARCQRYGDVLKVGLYHAGSLREDDLIPLYEIFIDVIAKHYVSRGLDGSGKETDWYTCMIDNLPNVSLGWNAKICIDKESMSIAKTIIGVENALDFHTALYDYQKGIRSYKREMARKRETDRWDKELSVVPALPSDWDEWCKEKIGYTYMFYKAGEKEITCCMCGQTTVLPERKNNMKYECPHCYREGTIYATGRIPRYLRTEFICSYIVQAVSGGYVVRSFDVQMSINQKKYKEPYISKRETKRIICRNGDYKEYRYELYKNIETRWCEVKYKYLSAWYSTTERDFTYTANLKEKSPEASLRSSIVLFVKNHKGKCNACDYARFENVYPWIETIYKSGLTRLTKDFFIRYGKESIVDSKQTELAKILKIDKGLLHRLRENNGGVIYLRFLQLEYKSKRHYTENIIKEFAKANIEPDDIEFIVDRMAPRAILNYVTKQAKNMNETMRRTCKKWEDYLNMAQKAKMQVNTEQIYKPKSLVAAHGMVISILESEKIEEQIKEIKKKWKNVEKHCQELTKYEYSDSEFAIIAPKSIKDIFIEGMTLSHCIHTCDFYFDRINNKESYLLFLRRKKDIEASWYTLEVEPSGNIRQKSTVGDNLNKDFVEAVPFLKKWQKEIKKRLTEEDKELAKKSEELRIQNYANLRKNKNRIWHGVLQGKLLVDVLEDRFMAAE